MEFKVIITGATGMVGEGVLLECLAHPQITAVMAIGRRPSGIAHPKLKECIVSDFMHINSIEEQLKGYDACFYCAGISSNGLSEQAYTHITYDTTLHFAETLLKLNPNMVFGHISGSSTDSSETGKVMWARVKGKIENALIRLPFKSVYNFRPGFMKPVAGQKNVKGAYKIVVWLFPLLLVLFPKKGNTISELAQAMINSVLKGYNKSILEVSDIKFLAKA